MCGSPQIEANHMTNLTVKPGAKVVFNCKVNEVTIRDLYAYYSRLTSRAWCPLSAGTTRWRMVQRCWSRPHKTLATPTPWTSPLSPWQTWGCTPVWQGMWLAGIMLLPIFRWITGARLEYSKLYLIFLFSKFIFNIGCSQIYKCMFYEYNLGYWVLRVHSVQ